MHLLQHPLGDHAVALGQLEPGDGLGRNNRAMPRSRVDFPQALAPTIMVTFPSGISAESPSIASRMPPNASSNTSIINAFAMRIGSLSTTRFIRCLL